MHEIPSDAEVSSFKHFAYFTTLICNQLLAKFPFVKCILSHFAQKIKNSYNKLNEKEKILKATITFKKLIRPIAAENVL